MSPKITELETFFCELPKRREWTQHGIPATLDRRVIVALRTDSEHVGWGEATALPQWGGLAGAHYGETRETVSTIIHDVCAPLLLGADPLALPGILQSLDFAVRGHPYAKAAIEIALQDLRGQLFDAPIHQLLGGPVRDRVRIAHMITLMPLEEALAEARSAVERDGVTAFQIKGGLDIERDVALVAAFRQDFGSAVAIRLDANRGYGRQSVDVKRACCRLEAAGVDAVEQPANSIRAMAVAQAAVSIPIVADEACWTPEDVLTLFEAGACSAVSVYVAKAGGIAAASDVIRVADLVGFSTDLNGSLESGIGTAASLHVAMAAASVVNPSIIPVPSLRERPITSLGGRYWEDDLVSHGFSWEDGHLRPGSGPGLGVAIDEERVAHYAGRSRRRDVAE